MSSHVRLTDKTTGDEARSAHQWHPVRHRRHREVIWGVRFNFWSFVGAPVSSSQLLGCEFWPSLVRSRFVNDVDVHLHADSLPILTPMVTMK